MKGRWIDNADSYICSVCGHEVGNPNKLLDPHVCPHCYAELDTGKDQTPKRTVVFDFDGVIHSYTSGWQGIGETPDPVVPGIREAIRDLRDRGYEVVVQSTRCTEEAGMDAIIRFLKQNSIEVDNIVAEKPPAIVYVDDRAITFTGDTTGLVDRITSFQPWTQKKPDLDVSNDEISKLKSTPMAKNVTEIGYWVDIRKWWQGGNAYKVCSVCKTICFVPFKRLKECPCCHSKMVKEAPR